MKKLPIFLMMLAVAGLISSCKQNVSTPQANLTNEMDSLAYAIGVARTQGLTQYLMQSDIDSSYTEEFIKGFNEGAVMGKNDVKKMAYVMGIQIGQQFGNQMLDQLNQQIFGADSAQQLSKNNFIAGFDAAALNKNLKMSVEEASIYFETKIQALETKKMEKEFGFNRDAGYAFLEENKTKEGVVTLPSGLQYKVITQGKGAIPTTKDVVKVNYVGTLIDGTEFDSSYKRGEPATFATTGVIEGWTEALTMMPVGSKWMLYIPQELAYGAQRQGNINPFSTLVFEVELLDIVPQPAVK